MSFKLTTLAQNPNFMRYFKNSAWMMTEYTLKIISAIFVTIYIARYLGPDQFGILSYALAAVAIFTVISRLGMESILVRDIARYPELSRDYLGTGFALMLVAALVCMLTLSVLVYFFESDSNTRLYIWIISIGLIFQTFLVVDYNFQGQVKAKYSSFAKSIALGLGSLLKIYLVLIQADLWLFALAFMLDSVIVAFVLIVTHFFKKEIFFWDGFRKELIRPLLSSAWPMILSAVATILYMRVDLIMIKNMLDSHQLGLYAAATKVYEGWIIVPYVISISLLPAIVKLKVDSPEKYEIYLTKVFAVVFWISILVAVITFFTGHWILYYTFGPQFIGSEAVLSIVMWAAAFAALGSISARYLTVESLEKKIAFRTVIGLIMNVSLNAILIPKYGIEGAAIATLVTIVFVSYFINLFDKQLKQLLRICNGAIALNLKHVK